MPMLEKSRNSEINKITEVSDTPETKKKDLPREVPEDYESCKMDAPKEEAGEWKDSTEDDFEGCALEGKEYTEEEDEIADDYSDCGIEDSAAAENGPEKKAEGTEGTGPEEKVKETEEAGPEEKVKETEEAGPEEKPEKTEEIEPEEKPEDIPEANQENNAENTAEKSSEKDGLAEMREASDRKARELENAEREKEALEERARESFDELMSCDRADPQYKEKLNNYNSLRKQIEAQEESIIGLENEKGRLDKNIADKEHDILNEGDWAAYYSEERVKLREEYQQRFDQEFYEKRPNEKSLRAIREDNERLIEEMRQEKDSLQRARDLKMEQLSSYVTGNNLSRYEASQDPVYQKLNEEYIKYQEAYHRLDYSIVKLEDHNLQISESLGEKPDASNPGGEELSAWGGVINANFEYGAGGGRQYFVPEAMELKRDGKLQAQSVEFDSAPHPEKAEASAEAVEDTSYEVHIDRRPLTQDDINELEQLDENTPPTEDIEKSNDMTPGTEESALTASELEQLDENTIDTGALNEVHADQTLEDYKRPLGNQEDSEGLYYPDGWKAEKIEPGTVLYQLSINGDTPSSYFTDAVTVDSCRDSNGEVNFDKLRDKLQVSDPERKICLTKYVYEPENIRDTSVEAGLHKIDEQQETE